MTELRQWIPCHECQLKIYIWFCYQSECSRKDCPTKLETIFTLIVSIVPRLFYSPSPLYLKQWHFNLSCYSKFTDYEWKNCAFNLIKWLTTFCPWQAFNLITPILSIGQLSALTIYYFAYQIWSACTGFNIFPLKTCLSQLCKKNSEKSQIFPSLILAASTSSSTECQLFRSIFAFLFRTKPQSIIQNELNQTITLVNMQS